jgi:hypothetical protein
MKNKSLVIAAVIVLLILLLGAAGFMMMGKKGVSAPKVTTENSKTTQPQQTAKSLLDLVRAGQNVRCTFKSTVENGSSDGTVYVSGQNVRGDFTVTLDNKPQQTSMIRKGDTTYVWGGILTEGIKMTLSLDQVSGNNQASKYVDPNQKVDYSCSPWSVDQSLFTPPTNITFRDMTSLLAPKTTGAQTAPQTQTGNATDPCNQIANETAKAACESALKQSGN